MYLAQWDQREIIFEVSFPKRSTSLLSSKQDLSSHLFFVFREFLGFFNTGKPDLTGNVASVTLKIISERSLTASSASKGINDADDAVKEASFRHALENLLRRSTTCCDDNFVQKFCFEYIVPFERHINKVHVM